MFVICNNTPTYWKIKHIYTCEVCVRGLASLMTCFGKQRTISFSFSFHTLRFDSIKCAMPMRMQMCRMLWYKKKISWRVFMRTSKSQTNCCSSGYTCMAVGLLLIRFAWRFFSTIETLNGIYEHARQIDNKHNPYQKEFGLSFFYYIFQDFVKCFRLKGEKGSVQPFRRKTNFALSWENDKIMVKNWTSLFWNIVHVFKRRAPHWKLFDTVTRSQDSVAFSLSKTQPHKII